MPDNPTGASGTDPNSTPTTGTGASGTGGDGGTAPTGAPSTPAQAFDFKALPAEAQTYLREQIAAAETKARVGSKANAAKEATDAITAKLAAALGLAPDSAKDPDALAKQLSDSQRETRELRVETAIERAARKAGGDEDLVTAWLAKHAKTKLKELNPTADDFRPSVEKLVKETLEAHPRLRAESPGAAPAARGGATSTAMAGPGAAAAQGGNVTPDVNSMSVDQMRKLLYPR